MDDDKGSRLADNILYFCRTLRRAGLAIGPGQVLDAGTAVLQAGISRRDDFYFALRSVLVTSPSQYRLFDQAFHIYFRNPRLLERMMELMLPTLEQITDRDDKEKAIRRLMEAMTNAERDSEEQLLEIDQSNSWSQREVLRKKDFEQMSLDEARDAKLLLQEEACNFREVAIRRFRDSNSGQRYDMRRTIRQMLRNNGQIVEMSKKKRRSKPPALVLICDISGSMSRYSRIFLQFAHTLCQGSQVVHSFVFGTRLTNISHRLADRDVDRALARISHDVQDWDGGTRIADSLQRFNIDWGRRVLSGRAIVVLLSDGLERDSEANLEFQMARLQRSADQVIWLNPMLRYEKFEPRAGGIKAMLPHVDRFLPAHNVDSLLSLGALLGGTQKNRMDNAA